MEWNNFKIYRHQTNNEYKAKYGHKKETSDPSKIDNLIANWNIFKPLLVSEPNSKYFQPIMQIKKFKFQVQKSLKRKYFFILFMTFITGLIFLYWNIQDPSVKKTNIVITCFASSTYFLIDYLINIKNVNNLKEISEFFTWVNFKGVKYFKFWLLITSAMGVFQLLLYLAFGEFDIVFYKVGAMYTFLDTGEYWRLLTGPYLHSSITHWLINSLTLTLIAPIICSLRNSNCVTIFVIGNTSGAIGAFLINLLNFSDADAFAGVSGGIYAFMGAIIYCAFSTKNAFPKHFYLYFITFILFNFILGYLLAPKISLTSHFFGLIAGYLTILFIDKFNKK